MSVYEFWKIAKYRGPGAHAWSEQYPGVCLTAVVKVEVLTSLCPDQQPWPRRRQSTGRLKPNTQSVFLDRTSRVNPYLPPYQRTPFSSQDTESSQFFLPVLCFLPTSFTPKRNTFCTSQSPPLPATWCIFLWWLVIQLNLPRCVIKWRWIVWLKQSGPHLQKMVATIYLWGPTLTLTVVTVSSL